jgi:hypothetical protein
MPTVFSNPPRKGQPARIWHLEEVWEHAKRLVVFQKPLAELNSLDEVAWYGSEYHFGRLTVREVAEHSRRIQAATFKRPIILSCEGWLMDGFHRLAKAHLDGLETIPAVQFAEDPPPNRVSSWHEWHEATLRD